MPNTLIVQSLSQQVQDHKTSVVRIDAAQLDQVTPALARTDYNRSRMERVLGRGESSWTGEWMGCIGSIDNARKLFSQGWQEGAERAMLLRDQIGDVVPNSVVRRRVRRAYDDGTDLRIEQAMQGEWDTAWWDARKEYAPAANVVSITCGWIAMNYIQHEALIWNAVQAIVLTDLLENAGYRVELRALDCVKIAGKSNLHFTEMRMKRADEPLQADLVAATIGHAGVYRSLGFAAMCCHPTSTDEVLGRDPGMTLRTLGIDAAIAEQALDPISYRLPRGDSQDAAVKNIHAAIAALAPAALV